jgi:hypothetical protein
VIELNDNALGFSFPEVHEGARLQIEFQRTLRIPDNDKTYPLPPGLGRFPLRHVDDHAAQAPKDWLKRGGVMLPMYQAEALWINFNGGYPMAVKIATGKVNAVSGKLWKDKLNRNPQDYVVATEQPWLDGYCVEKGVIRQFVAMPLGSGVTAEEQVTGKAEHGGLQIIAYPMKKEAYERYFGARVRFQAEPAPCMVCECSEMGLAPGGRMKQEIYEDEYKLADWDLAHSSRCFVHICNSMVWHQLTGEWPPTVPPTAKEYTAAGLPWFDYYDDKLNALKGSSDLAKLKSVGQFGKKKGALLPENAAVNPGKVVKLGPSLKPGQVREWAGA